jgi:predicted hotdog family 3-hydroxylacyl-ACP dehydratase
MDIEAYMPHRGKMKLIEDIVEADGKGCIAVALPSAGWPFQTAGGIDPIITVELIAQATSAYVGWCRRHEKLMGGAGFLVGIRSASFSDKPLPTGISVSIACSRTLVDMDNYGVFEGRVYCGDIIFGSATIQVYNP